LNDSPVIVVRPITCELLSSSFNSCKYASIKTPSKSGKIETFLRKIRKMKREFPQVIRENP
jgi:hypothetical protein